MQLEQMKQAYRLKKRLKLMILKNRYNYYPIHDYLVIHLSDFPGHKIQIGYVPLKRSLLFYDWDEIEKITKQDIYKYLSYPIEKLEKIYDIKFLDRTKLHELTDNEIIDKRIESEAEDNSQI